MKYLSLFFAFILACLSLQAQDFKQLCELNLQTEADFRSTESEVKACIDFLMQESLASEGDRRAWASAFLTNWMIGAPYVEIYMGPAINKLMHQEGQLLTIYWAGGVDYLLQNPAASDKDIELAGIQAVYDFTKANNGVKINRKLKQFLTAGDAGELELWIAKQKYLFALK
ncbi:MAG: hypothetical protein AAF927_34270 [Bacteroidota bacterium]